MASARVIVTLLVGVEMLVPGLQAVRMRIRRINLRTGKCLSIDILFALPFDDPILDNLRGYWNGTHPGDCVFHSNTKRLWQHNASGHLTRVRQVCPCHDGVVSKMKGDEVFDAHLSHMRLVNGRPQD